MPAHGPGNGWWQALSGVAGLLALIAAMTAIIRPVTLQIGQINRAQDKADDWIGEHDRRIEARDAAQWERIKSLERAAFGSAFPITISPGDEP